MSYKVFADFHHSSLLNSLIMLFEGRLNGELYRPIGTDWHAKGYWKLFDHPATVEQFLGIGGATPDGTEPVNEVVGKTEPGVYNCFDIDSHKTNKAITHEAFNLLPFDFVIASIPQHIEPFRRLCNEHPHKPKLLYQVGNAWNITDDQLSLIDGILASAKLNRIPNVPYVEYHQEFDLNVFLPYPPNQYPGPLITSFVNCFGVDGLFEFDWELFRRIENMMPEWSFKALGGQCRDGAAHGSKELAGKMHTKNGGDGYGHVIHNAAAVGRPMIVRKSYYSGKMGDSLMIDGVTCIAIDGLTDNQIVTKILEYSRPHVYAELCHNVIANFKRVVNFDDEALNIQNMLERLTQAN